MHSNIYAYIHIFVCVWVYGCVFANKWPSVFIFRTVRWQKKTFYSIYQHPITLSLNILRTMTSSIAIEICNSQYRYIPYHNIHFQVSLWVASSYCYAECHDAGCRNAESQGNSHWLTWAIFTTLCFLRNLRIGPISERVFPWQAFLAKSHVTF